MDNQLNKLEEYYGARLVTGLNSSQKLGWESADAHYARFRTLCRNIDMHGKSILDVGAGLGDLWHHLNSEHYGVDYTGVDIMPAMIERARARFPEVRFQVCDIIGVPGCLGEDFDVVYSSGIFNLSATSDYAFLRAAYDSFCQIAREAVVISLLSTASKSQEPQYRYFDPEAVARGFSENGWNCSIVDGYLDNDFTIFARNPDFGSGTPKQNENSTAEKK